MLAFPLARWLTRHGVHYGWVMVAITFMTTVCSSTAISLSGILVLPLIQEFGWGRANIAGVMGVMLLLFAGTAPFAGAILLRYGLCRTVIAAVTMTLLGLGLTSLMATLWQFAVAFGVPLGIAAGVLAMALPASIANRWFVHRRGLAMGILTAAFAAGQLAFMPTNAWLATHYGWRTALVPVGITAVLCLLLYGLFGRDWPADVGQAPYGGQEPEPQAHNSAGNAIVLSLSVLRDAAGTRVFWVLASTFLICGVSTTGIISQHFIPFCADNGIVAVVAATYLAVMGIFNFVGTIASGWLSDRFDNRVLLAWYYGLRGLSLIWLPFSSFDVYALSLWAVFFGLDFVATVPPTVKLSAQHFGSERAPIVVGWVFAFHQLGGAAAAFAAGVTRATWASYGPAFLAIGVTCLAATAAMFAVRDIRMRPATARVS
ncbi:MAG TPA: MFS transporter [Acetobacteraceae bacterium]|nr:MFS transporter [Acetobacteraceae bacterium]